MNKYVDISYEQFNSNAGQAFKSFRKEQDLLDVTLVCDDGEIDAHKLVLYSGSEFFKSALKKSKHQHPLLYMKGIKIKYLEEILDFLYKGEVNIALDDFKEFIETASDLQIKGITEDKISSFAQLDLSQDYDRNESQTKTKEISQPPNDVKVEPENRIVDIKQEIGEKGDNENSSIMEIYLEEDQNSSCESTINDDLDEDVPLKKANDHSYTKTIMEPFSESVEKNDVEFGVGTRFVSKEEVLKEVEQYCDATFSPLIIQSSGFRGTSKQRFSYKCRYGILKKSESLGKRQVTQRYVGCPALLNINQQQDGTFEVTKAVLEHKEHKIGEEEYATFRRKLSKDQKEAVKAFLVTQPSNQAVSLFLSDLTGKQYNRSLATNIVNALKRDKIST